MSSECDDGEQVHSLAGVERLASERAIRRPEESSWHCCWPGCSQCPRCSLVVLSILELAQSPASGPPTSGKTMPLARRAAASPSPTHTYADPKHCRRWWAHRTSVSLSVCLSVSPARRLSVAGWLSAASAWGPVGGAVAQPSQLFPRAATYVYLAALLLPQLTRLLRATLSQCSRAQIRATISGTIGGNARAANQRVRIACSLLILFGASREPSRVLHRLRRSLFLFAFRRRARAHNCLVVSSKVGGGASKAPTLTSRSSLGSASAFVGPRVLRASLRV